MKKILLLAVFMAVALGVQGQVSFEKHFSPKTLRLDYYHCGSANDEQIYLKELIEEPHWAGNPNSLIDDKEYGNHLLKVTDAKTGELLYSTGYCSLFNEWQSTEEALTTQRCYPEGVVMPYPKNIVVATLYSRDKKNQWKEIFNYEIDPSSYWVRKSNPSDETFDVHYSGAAQKKVDVVLLGEGYTDRAKFEYDCKRFAEELFKYEPFKSRAKDFNVRAVWKASKDSGTSLPGENIWKQSALSANYYTFDSERYLTVADQQGIRDLAANVPYDVVYILSDTRKYGGGGIYNFYGISAAGDPNFAGKVYVHEFGHLFVGLGDEYVGTTSFDGMYPKDTEPWEENLTTLVDFERKMWHSMLPKGTKIPTADTEANDKKLGVFEGGGYQKEGIYRPWRMCMMRHLQHTDDFCPVCTATLNYKIDFYTK